MPLKFNADDIRGVQWALNVGSGLLAVAGPVFGSDAAKSYIKERSTRLFRYAESGELTHIYEVALPPSDWAGQPSRLIETAKLEGDTLTLVLVDVGEGVRRALAEPGPLLARTTIGVVLPSDRSLRSGVPSAPREQDL